jgi:methyl-accepting chemotaxis protein
VSIKRRIWALPFISTLLFGVGVAVSVTFSGSAIESIHTTEEIDYPVLEQTKTLKSDAKAFVDSIKQTVSEGDKAGVATIDELAKKIRIKINTLGQLPGQEANAERLLREFEAYYDPALHLAKLMLGDGEGDVQSGISKMQSALKVLETDLDASVTAAQAQFASGIELSGDNVQKVLYAIILAGIIVVLTLVIVSHFLVRTIWHQLGGEPEYAREIAAAVSSGDLSQPIYLEQKDSTSILAALKEMQDKLQMIVGEVKASADTITFACAEIASGNSDLSSRTEAQASSLEETSSSMESLTETVRENVGHAKQAHQMVERASAVATKGGEVFGQVVQTMSGINESSKKIVDIISVIDGIAFQTNILALNAAVEAARAGEQGRGFAVVASEVRSLAQRSAGAAKEIKQLIDDSVQKVASGTQLVDQAGHTMDEIVASVKRVSEIMTEISAASQEQSSGIQEVGQAVAQMDEMTQQNAALVEEAAATAESLEEQAQNLTKVLGVFKLSQAQTSAYVGKAPPAFQQRHKQSTRLQIEHD